MSLLDLWKDSKEQLADKQIQQLISFAGNGKLSDGNQTSNEFREFLTVIPSEKLAKYIKNCLESRFDNSGFVLQDLVNEIGQRLGFDVTPGRYRGTTGHTGFDALWRSPTGEVILVEIKTTSAYSFDLDVVAGYRSKLILNGEVPSDLTSILIVVGRFDTGGWEAQIRGSKHAWDTRLISIDSITRLLNLKENLDDPSMFIKIRELLSPHEYTRVDGIIDLVFSTAEDIKDDQVMEIDEIDTNEGDINIPSDQIKKPKFTPVAFHGDCIKKVEIKLGIDLVKQSKASFATPDKKVSVVCCVSSEKYRTNYLSYWYAFYTYQRDYLKSTKNGYLALGCGTPDMTLLIPISDIVSWLDALSVTDKGRLYYWHLHIHKKDEKLNLVTKADSNNIPLNKYII